MKRIVVFDLDGTIGYFSQLSMLIKGIEKIINQELPQNYFNMILDMNKEYLRPDICGIFKYLMNKKEIGEIDRICIYTNNNGPKSWTYKIKNYLEYYCEGLIFDNIICAFTNNGEIIEKLRTTNQKTYEDLVNCTRLPNNTQVCFIDDKKHQYMEHDNVYYIHVKPYIYSISPNILVERLISSNIFKINNKYSFKSNLLNSFLIGNYKYSKKNEKEYEIDKIISKQILKLIREF